MMEESNKKRERSRKRLQTYPTYLFSVYVNGLRGAVRGANGDERRCTSMENHVSASNEGGDPGVP